jgi:hypothetical protein
MGFQGRALKPLAKWPARAISWSMAETETKPPAPKPPPPPVPKEVGGPKGPEPTRYGDWEQKGRCTDF